MLGFTNINTEHIQQLLHSTFYHKNFASQQKFYNEDPCHRLRQNIFLISLCWNS